MVGYCTAAVSALLLMPMLMGQTGPDAMLEQRRREMESFERQAKVQHRIGGQSDLSRAVMGEVDDDPTSTANTPLHDPDPKALKLAESAEKLSAKNKHEDAIAAITRALTIDPQYYEAENNLALEYWSVGDKQKSVAVLKNLTQRQPNRVLAFNNLARILYLQGNYTEAEQAARSALKMHHYSFKANYYLGAALVAQGKWNNEAKQDLEYAELKHPEAKALLAKWPPQGLRAP